MKTLVVFYSRTGHNEQIAKQLHREMAGEIDHTVELDQIVDMTKRDSMFWAVVTTLLKRKTTIHFGKDPAAYDQVIVVSPLWAGQLPPATRAYLAQNRTRLNNFSFLSVSGFGEENKKALADLVATAKKQPAATLLIKEGEVESEGSKEKVATFMHHLPIPAH